MLNVYVHVSVGGSSGRLRVLSSLYLRATAVILTLSKHSLMREMFQSWVGLVLFFLVFTHFKTLEGKLLTVRVWTSLIFEIRVYFPLIGVEHG